MCNITKKYRDAPKSNPHSHLPVGWNYHSFAQGTLNTGAERTEEYLPLLKGKRVGMVINPTSVIGEEQACLLDTLLSLNINVVKVFAPEHGFRGDADAGETVKDGKDSQTGTPIVSLYGNNKKPTVRQLQDVDIICSTYRMSEPDSTLISVPCSM